MRDRTRPAKGPGGREDNRSEDGNDALAGDRRGTNKQPELALARDNDGLDLRIRSAKLNQDNDRRSRCNRDDRVHDDAQLALVGIVLIWMNVRNLRDSQQREQNEAQTGYHRHELLPAAFRGSEGSVRQPHWWPRRSHFTKERTYFDGLWRARLPAGAVFVTSINSGIFGSSKL